jgi:hypothetical protein
MPVPRKREIRREGFLGLQQNQQDIDHDKRVRAIENKALQTDYFLQGATHLEYRAVKRNVEAVDAMEREIVDQTQAGTATAAFAEELWNDAANRLRAIQDEGIRIYHTEGRKILEEDS